MAQILVVEDDGALREELAGLLSGWGHQVTQARNGRQAFDAMESLRPDLVLSDIQMPGGSGVEFVQRVRSLGLQYADVAFLFISSSSTPSAVAQGISSGADDFIAKPVVTDLLKAKIEAHLRKKEGLTQKIMLERLVHSVQSAIGRGAAFASAGGIMGIVCLAFVYWLKVVMGVDPFENFRLSDFL